MTSSFALERTDTYLQSQWRDSRSPLARTRTGGPFITISRAAGSGGSTLARILVRKLNAETPPGVVWRVFEGAITARMLEMNQLPRRLARFLPEDRVPEVGASIGELLGLHPNLWALVQKTNETMRQLATSGHVILVGRGANFATANLTGGLHVRLVAPAEHRARYLAELYNLPLNEAAVLNARCDAARRRYIRTHFNADLADPSAYDLVLNTARIALDDAADVIGARCHRLAS